MIICVCAYCGNQYKTKDVENDDCMLLSHGICDKCYIPVLVENGFTYKEARASFNRVKRAERVV
jgi:hypothetical protein